MSKLGAVGILVVVLGLVVIGPLAFLWALNTLFPVLHIPYTVTNWFAALLIGGGLTLRGSSK